VSDIYIDAATGNDTTGNGSAAQPYATWWGTTPAAAIAAGSFTNGDTLFLAGTFRAPIGSTGNLVITSKTGIRVTAWPGRDRPVLRRDQLVTGTWANTATDRAAVTTSTGLAIAGLVFAYDRTIDADGRHRAFLRPVADVAAVNATANSYFYNSGTGALNINVAGLAANNPQTASVAAEVAWVSSNSNENTVQLVSCTDCIVDNLTSILAAPLATGSGYGIMVQNGLRVTVRNCVARDCGYHGIGFVGANTINCVIEDCEVWGGNNAGTPIVFYAGPNPATVVGCRCRRTTVHNYCHLRPDGTSLFTTDAQQTGIFSHVDGYPSYIEDLEITDCYVRCYPTLGGGGSGGFYGNAIGVVEIRDVSFTDTNHDSYPVRVSDCVFVDCGGGGSQGSISFRRCSVSGRTLNSNLAFRFPAPNGFPDAPRRKSIRMEACEIIHRVESNASSGSCVQTPVPNFNYSVGSVTYTNSTRTLSLAGRFPFVPAVGDTIQITGGTNMTPGTYTVESVNAANTAIVLTAVAGTGDSTNATLTTVTAVPFNITVFLDGCTLLTSLNFGIGTGNGSSRIIAYNSLLAQNAASVVRINANRSVIAWSSVSPANGDHVMMDGLNGLVGGYNGAAWIARMQFASCLYQNVNRLTFVTGTGYITPAQWATTVDANALTGDAGFWGSVGDTFTTSLARLEATGGTSLGPDIRRRSGPGRGAFRGEPLTGLRGLRVAPITSSLRASSSRGSTIVLE
jgi:hypothetical protein